jgi:hypothetical protein
MESVMGMCGQELTGTGSPDGGQMVITDRHTGLDGLCRAVVAAVAFGLLMALWVVLWIPSAPVP